MSRDHPWLFDATIWVSPETNETQIVAHNNQDKSTSKTFPQNQLTPLTTWLQNPSTWSEVEIMAKLNNTSTMTYSHEDGMITLTTHTQSRKFDPNNDESMASMVRLIKRLTPIPRDPAQPPLPNILPTPTPEQLANAQIFTQVGGRSRQKKTTVASSVKSQVLIQSIMADLLKEY